jgi:hypothetical protein
MSSYQSNTTNKRGQETTVSRHLRVIQDRYNDQQLPEFDMTVDEEDEREESFYGDESQTQEML